MAAAGGGGAGCARRYERVVGCGGARCVIGRDETGAYRICLSGDTDSSASCGDGARLVAGGGALAGLRSGLVSDSDKGVRAAVGMGW